MERREQDHGQKIREAFEHSDEIGSITTRRLWGEKMANPSEEESRKALEMITSEVLNPALQDYTNIDILKKFKKIASEKYGFPLSPPFLSKSVIVSIAMKLNREVTQEFKNTSLLSSIPIEHICAYDMNVGIIQVLSTIRDAEFVLNGTYDKEMGVLYDEWSEVISPLVQAESLLAEKTKALEYATLLKENPTGKSLIRHAVEEVENPQTDFTPYLKEFVVAGARFAQNAYETIYPLAERVSKLS